VDGAVFIGNGLMPVGNIDDAQTPHGHAEIGLRKYALIVGAPVAQRTVGLD
jgi:hypothetical protein